MKRIIKPVGLFTQLTIIYINVTTIR